MEKTSLFLKNMMLPAVFMLFLTGPLWSQPFPPHAIGNCDYNVQCCMFSGEFGFKAHFSLRILTDLVTTNVTDDQTAAAL